MKRQILSLLIALPISAVATEVLFFASAFAGAACHCMTPVSIFFPYGTFITMRTSWEATGLYADVLQFPFYSIVVAIVNGGRRRILAAAVILIVHSIVAIGALTMYQWW
jgi:hypothetical protein